jgi:pyruvate dehydrogenase E2 component (dihydrolipoamide acetyltransferase)
MALSWAQIPHVTHNDVADITELEAFRQRHVKTIEAKGGKLTLTVLVMKAVAAALHEFPRFNASLDHETEALILKRYYHLGIALDSERGLLVPVIRDVDRKSLTDLAVELFQLAERVRKGDVKREDVSGGTFTITNPGPMGGTTFTPIINYPEVAILGLGRARLQPVVRGTLEKPEIVPRLLLPISFGFDHRINDGADAARFVNKVIHTLTNLEAFTLAI